MTESDLKELISGSANGSGANPFSQVLEPLMPMLTILLIVSIVLSVIFVVYFIISIIQKQRQHRAIIRIDKNLQKLVDFQIKPEQTLADKE